MCIFPSTAACHTYVCPYLCVRARVLCRWISQIAADGSLASLRVFRVLRPLRTISRVRGMRILVRALLNSLPALRDVLFLFR